MRGKSDDAPPLEIGADNVLAAGLRTEEGILGRIGGKGGSDGHDFITRIRQRRQQGRFGPDIGLGRGVVGALPGLIPLRRMSDVQIAHTA